MINKELFLAGKIVTIMPFTLPIESNLLHKGGQLYPFIGKELMPAVQNFLGFEIDHFADYVPCDVHTTNTKNGTPWHTDPFIAVNALMGLQGCEHQPLVIEIDGEETSYFLDDKSLILYSGRAVRHKVDPPADKRRILSCTFRLKGEYIEAIDGI